MNRSNYESIRLMLVAVVTVMVLGGGRANADFIFGAPVHLGPPINSPYGEGVTFITADSLEMYLSCYIRPGGLGDWDIWVLRRKTVNDDWGEPENLGLPANTAGSESNAHLSPDGLEMYFTASSRPGGYGDYDIWVTRRTTRNDPWAQPENLGAVVNTAGYEHCPRISADGLELYFCSDRSGGYGAEDIWVAKRATRSDPWAEAVNLGPPVNSSASEDFPLLSSDGLLLFVSGAGWRQTAPRPGGYGRSDMWLARRASVSEPWGAPVNLGPIMNTSSHDLAATFSPDGHSLYFGSDRSGGLGGVYGDTYQSPILPIVDFTGDGTVAIEDLVLLIDNWGQNEPLCDIGPMPWGDGIVDVQDLEMLMSYWGQEGSGGTLLAHWQLDETEGMIARDNTGRHDGTVIGLAAWRPAGGAVDGALELDGATVVVADHVLNPADGPFSVFAWVRGGAPGQVLVSQATGMNWLLADSTGGCLMTEAKSDGRSSFALCSQIVITDGDWHRVGLVWDGAARSLHVDDVLVAEDTQSRMVSCSGGLNLGCGTSMAPSTFFSGLIDDVRIYNRAVKP